MQRAEEVWPQVAPPSQVGESDPFWAAALAKKGTRSLLGLGLLAFRKFSSVGGTGLSVRSSSSGPLREEPAGMPARLPRSMGKEEGCKTSSYGEGLACFLKTQNSAFWVLKYWHKTPSTAPPLAPPPKAVIAETGSCPHLWHRELAQPGPT